MTETENARSSEIERIRRVADQLCTAHAALRDRFASRQSAIDIVVLLLSAWTASMGFVDPRLTPWLTPPHLDAQLWIGILGSITFGLALIQFKADWRGRSEAHKRSFTMYSEVKREAGYLLANLGKVSDRDFQRLADRYDMASDVGAGVPEKDFLKLKRRHKLKVAISRILDEKPGSSLWLIKLKLLLRDNYK
ncbi:MULTISPECIES: hypothetical protein [Bradyrhizobium]|jgi:hypothetical protein|uniref:DUF4231 domain-containing protein n=2 Tax=Bradyrhizobium TaxID=374 RepID=A0ABY0PT37_9BRAD|nr:MULTISPECIES: hypothetical protein [Bradyrhizobium]SDI90701.1 hypothetical protein SAMN05444163_4042 [Bradyrhizobium ottawaense]SED09694.1 hypothetical protein SAMN05444171_3121 [Bradyrhizobium lablabi]SHL16161.1 hypothetical protein SAMN05444321_1959 [Bradyrhizobium lablabi]